MQIVTSVVEMQRVCRELRANGAVLGFVPTMGALHAGHLSLVRRARAECDVVAASIFVNPLQFGPTEDFSQYPRMFTVDCELLEAEGVKVLFAPEATEMYSAGAVTTVTVGEIGERLDGASRPGHFTGVATVVAKLLHVVRPARAYFGQKDAAQLAVLRAMVRDLNFDVSVVGCEIVRDADGLALSSRNRYLSEVERGRALALRGSLLAMERMIADGERSSAALMREGMRVLDVVDGVRVDYLAVVNAETLAPVLTADSGALVAVAAWVGRTRLIDNFLVGQGSVLFEVGARAISNRLRGVDG
jgi:pantoate--beta-alanine ligase